MEKDDKKIKRLCTQCKYFLAKEKSCKVNKKHCIGGHKTACTDWVYKYRIKDLFFCSYLGKQIDSEKCEGCVIRCLRSESRKEVDYARKDGE